MDDAVFDPIAYAAHVREIRRKFYPSRPTSRAQVEPVREPADLAKYLPKPVPAQKVHYAPWYWDELSTMPAPQRARAIKLRVADRYGIELAHIEGQSRKTKYVKPRYEAIVEVYRANTEWSLPRIGMCFGERDHTTIIHALRKMGIQGPGRKEHLRPQVWPLHQRGLTPKQIAEKLGRPVSAINACIRNTKKALAREASHD